MASVLSKIVKTDAETKEHLESIDTTLGKIYELQLGTEKRESKEAKRKKQSDKRRKGDSFLDRLNLDEKEKKEQRKGLFDTLKDFFGKLGSGLVGGIGGLISNLFGTKGPIAGIITGAFKHLFRAAGSVMKGMTKAIGGILGSPWFWKAAAAAGLTLGAVKATKNVSEKIGSALGRSGKTEQGTTFEYIDVIQLNDKFRSDNKDTLSEEELNSKTREFTALADAMKAGKGQKDDIEKKQKERDEAIADRERIKATWNAKIAAEKDERKKNNMIQSRAVALGSINPRINRLNTELRTLNHNHLQNTKKITNLSKDLIPEQDLVQLQLSQGRRASIPENLKGKVTAPTLLEQATSGFGSAEEYEKNLTEQNRQGYQTGGPITVPGSGSGDKVPMTLPPGSFVMNRNAAQRFQEGGIPTLLEPKEKVFLPGQWDSSHFALNESIPRFQTGGTVPRFQTGGIVEASHPDTGTGWSVGKDQQGRPAVFSKSAAQALLQAIKDSNGAVKASDITSSTRSPSKNAAVGGVANSNHLHGNAVDIHGTSKVWLKANGLKYGWKNLVYSGHDGHFDFTKGGALPAQQENNETTADQDNNKEGGGGVQGLISSLGSIGGKFGEFVAGALGSLGDMFGDESSGVMDAIFGGANMLSSLVTGDSTTPGDPNLSTESPPLTGDTLAMAKKMYEYAKSKGLSEAQAKGLIANIQRESSFDVDAVGDGGDSHGLFQWNTGRADKMKSALPNYATNWKGQIDYALSEHVGPDYKSETAGMSAKDAGYWWMNKWEIPSDRARGGPNHQKMNGFIDTYKFQKGGVVSRSPQPNIKKASEQMATRRHLAKSSGNNIKIIPQQGPSRASKNSNPGAQNQPPTLSAYPSNSIAMDLAYRTSIGGVF